MYVNFGSLVFNIDKHFMLFSPERETLETVRKFWKEIIVPFLSAYRCSNILIHFN